MDLELVSLPARGKLPRVLVEGRNVGCPHVPVQQPPLEVALHSGQVRRAVLVPQLAWVRHEVVQLAGAFGAMDELVRRGTDHGRAADAVRAVLLQLPLGIVDVSGVAEERVAGGPALEAVRLVAGVAALGEDGALGIAGRARKLGRETAGEVRVPGGMPARSRTVAVRSNSSTGSRTTWPFRPPGVRRMNGTRVWVSSRALGHFSTRPS